MDNYFKKPTKADFIKKTVAIHTEDTFYDICERYIPASLKQTELIAVRFKKQKNSYLTSKKIYAFVKTYIKYREDEKGFEEIRFPNKLWKDKVGDCEDFTIFCSSILCNLGISHTIRMADYGKGWQHIYIKVGNTVLDPVQDMFNYEDKGKYIDYEIKTNGLGKLPTNLYSARETFIVKLWNTFQKDGVVYNKDIETNTIPTENVESLVGYLKNKLEVKAVYLPAEKKEVIVGGRATTVNFAERIKVELENTTLTFDPETISRLVAKIAGNEALKPQKTRVKEGFQPDNVEFMNLFRDFVNKNDGMDEDLYTGVNFSENGLAATNNYSFLYFNAKTDYRGTYTLDGKPINSNKEFVDYLGFIKGDNDPRVTITPTLKEFDTFFQTAFKLSNYGDKASKPIIIRSSLNPYEFEINTENITYDFKTKELVVQEFKTKLISNTSFDSFLVFIEGNFFKQILKLLNKLQVKEFTLSISTTTERLRPIILQCDTKYGELIYMLQPLNRIENSKMSIIKQENGFRKQLISFKEQLQKI
ncbi:transglutaminase-like domain-containing protein [Arcicella sp. DC2W]|uniref:Transglutaminase-like domain-containing protein n=1 Tax=Arcicella gelida TaxID=2984195 RepID=A0ABU5S2B9_9BACT|nr:transglutaminase-like domain-containing protein [Arcicella sp. DC2W]MEA5402610.1 transglutaminase-like domain-containing protein [Arcicella sp. DC2W]